MSLKEQINFSIWCDFIERDFLQGEFKDLINSKVIHGATSNPAIFEQALKGSPAYKQQFEMLKGNVPKKIYEDLALKDIKSAANILAPLHSNNYDDGFISIEVDPRLCDDAQGTIDEGLRIFKFLGSDNVMIKIPATEAGYIAMKELSAKGVNINATLVFSPAQAIKCAKALNEGMKETNKDIKAVISVFVSRFDRMCDSTLVSKGFEPAKLGIMNAIKCYYEVVKFNNRNIRTLFASTGVKGDDLAPSYYVDNLLFANAINTAPLATIQAWMKNGLKEVPEEKISEKECDIYLQNLKDKNFDIEEIYAKLLDDGLSSFVKSFGDMLSLLEK